MKVCADETCENVFSPNKHNQIYCSAECCRVATNRRLLDKYYEKKARLQGKVRTCKSCGQKLSRYNSQKVCSICQQAQDSEKKTNLKRLIEG
jgi:rubrerythrin